MPNRKGLTFTKHAFDRVGERLWLTPAEIATIIETEQYIRIGEEKNRVHKVFYSKPDRQCFVAIHDERAHLNEIVTVLPLDYHHRWEISEAVFMAAKAKIVGEPELAEVPVVAPPIIVLPAVKSQTLQVPDVSGPSDVRVKFTCYFRCPVNRNIHTFVFKTKVVASELSVWLQQLDIYEFVKGYVGTEMWDSCQLKSVYYKAGKKGQQQRYPLP